MSSAPGTCSNVKPTGCVSRPPRRPRRRRSRSERHAAAAQALANAACAAGRCAAETQRATIARTELAAAAVSALLSESEAAAAHIAELTTSLTTHSAGADEAARQARVTCPGRRGAGAVDAAWEAVNAADRAVANAAGEHALRSAALAAARGRLSGSATDGGVARAVAAGTLQARRLVDACRSPMAPRRALAAPLEDHLGAWLVDDSSPPPPSSTETARASA